MLELLSRSTSAVPVQTLSNSGTDTGPLASYGVDLDEADFLIARQ